MSTVDLLCAAFPNVEREVLELCLETHQQWEELLGADYDVEAQLNKIVEEHISDAQRPPLDLEHDQGQRTAQCSVSQLDLAPNAPAR